MDEIKQKKFLNIFATLLIIFGIGLISYYFIYYENNDFIHLEDGHTFKIITNNNVTLGKEEEIYILFNNERYLGNIEWKSSNPNIAIVTNGKIKPLKVGKTTLTAKIETGDIKSVEINVVQTEILLKSFELIGRKNINVGSSFEVKVNYNPTNATNQKLNWTSSNTLIATVNNGIVRGVSVGTAKITAKSTNGKTATFTINVINDKNEIEKISITGSNTILVGESSIYSIVYTPTDAINKGVIWSTSDSKIATIDNNGKVSAIKEGKVKIIAETSNKIKTEKEISIIKKEIPVTSMKINGNNTVEVNKTLELSLSVTPSNATLGIVTWKSDNESIATVNNGKVTAKSSGKVKITAETNNKIIATKEITVVVPVTSITIDGKKTINVNETTTLTTKIYPSNATNKTVTWTSKDNSIAKVDTKGNVTGVKAGTTTITAKTNNNKTAEIIIEVKNPVVYATSIKLNSSSVNMYIDNQYTLVATITPSNTTNKTVTWTSNNENVATVVNGKITAKSEGSAIITATTSNGKTVSATINVVSNLTSNPISNKGADPYVMQKDGYYYGTMTTGRAVISVYKSKSLHNLFDESNIFNVFWNNINDNANNKVSQVVWAPEIHYIDGYWYIYYADTFEKGQGDYYRRMFVIRTSSSNPQTRNYEYLGQITDSTNKYAIDGTVLEWNNELYFVWSGRAEQSSNTQSIYIAHMSNPYTIDSERVQISKPSYSWELSGHAVNEGPQILIKNGKLHIIYSASGAYTKNYCLGMLTYNGGNILDKSSWIKEKTPVFKSGNDIYGPGHASFVKSPDGKEDWIVYHAYPSLSATSSWSNRDVRIQKFDWDGTTPVFGVPLKNGEKFKIPSGTK